VRIAQAQLVDGLVRSWSFFDDLERRGRVVEVDGSELQASPIETNVPRVGVVCEIEDRFDVQVSQDLSIVGVDQDIVIVSREHAGEKRQ
jgi:hypothetical protein